MNKPFKSPLFVSIDLTNKCNLSCIHCRNDKNSNLEIKYDKLTKIFEELEKLEVFHLSLAGGEPFLYSNINLLLNKISKLKIPKITIITNGTLITKKQLINLDRKKIRFVVSLDGPEKIHEFIRGRKLYSQIIKNIKLLVSEKFYVSLNFTIMKYNYKYFDEIIKIAKKLKVNQINFLKVFPVHESINKFTISDEELNKIYEKYKKYDSEKKIIIFFEKGYLGFPESIDNDIAFSMGCRAGISQVNIFYNGDVVGCKLLPNIIAGNIYKNSLTEIWNDNSAWKLFRTIDEKIDSKTCKSCKYFSGCRGGCRVLGYYLKNNIYAKDPSCPL